MSSGRFCFGIVLVALFGSRSFGSCFLGGSLGGFSGFGSGLGSGFGFSLGGFGFLLGYLLGDGFVHLLFSFQTAGLSLLSVGSYLVGGLAELQFALFLPSVEASLSRSLVESTLLHAAAQMLHQQYAFVRQDVANRVGGLGTYLYPIQGALKVEVHCGGVGGAFESAITML